MPRDESLDPALEQALLDELRSGQTIAAIKRYRQATGQDLKSSKDAVEILARRHGIAPKNVGCASSAGVLLVTGAWLWWGALAGCGSAATDSAAQTPPAAQVASDQPREAPVDESVAAEPATPSLAEKTTTPTGPAAAAPPVLEPPASEPAAAASPTGESTAAESPLAASAGPEQTSGQAGPANAAPNEAGAGVPAVPSQPLEPPPAEPSPEGASADDAPPATPPAANSEPADSEPAASEPAASEPFSFRRLIEPHLAADGVEALKVYRDWAERRLAAIQAIESYTMEMVKQEELDGQLGPREKMLVKVRHHPFSVYLRHLEPDKLEGQEALYVAGKNDNKLIGHGVGLRRFLGTLKLRIDSSLAMDGNRYPITHIGILYMAADSIKNIDHELSLGHLEVKFDFDARVDDRPCLAFDIRRTRRQPGDEFHADRRYIDNEYLFPVRYIKYGWPKIEGDPLPLLENYEHTRVRLNAGLTDRDFERDHPDYGF